MDTEVKKLEEQERRNQATINRFYEQSAKKVNKPMKKVTPALTRSRSVLSRQADKRKAIVSPEVVEPSPQQGTTRRERKKSKVYDKKKNLELEFDFLKSDKNDDTDDFVKPADNTLVLRAAQARHRQHSS